MSSFGENLKRIRESKNLTQQNLADHLYVTRQAVSRWECGARYPDFITTKKISKILDVSIDELMRDEDLKNYEDIKKADKRKIITVLFSIAVLFNIAYTLISTLILLSQFNFWQLKVEVGFKIFQSAFNTAVLIFIFILYIRKNLSLSI
ncbi:MAG: helix-turn-helix transcriptional regulator [Clostridia bacterium]|nr:helix-turn-helix transcriptional regulator [Clostridia bacterium]